VTRSRHLGYHAEFAKAPCASRAGREIAERHRENSKEDYLLPKGQKGLSEQDKAKLELLQKSPSPPADIPKTN